MGEDAGSGWDLDSQDVVHPKFIRPKITVWSKHDMATKIWEVVRCDNPSHRNPPDLRGQTRSKPDGIIRSSSDPRFGSNADRVLGHNPCGRNATHRRAVSKPHRPVGPQGNAHIALAESGNSILSNDAARSYASDGLITSIGEPHGPVRSHSDSPEGRRSVIAGSWGFIKRYNSCGRESANSLVDIISEPQCTIRSDCNAIDVCPCGASELCDRPGGGDSPESRAKSEPKSTVWTGPDRPRDATEGILREYTIFCNTPDPVGNLGEPYCTVRPVRNILWKAIRSRYRELRDVDVEGLRSRSDAQHRKQHRRQNNWFGDLQRIFTSVNKVPEHAKSNPSNEHGTSVRVLQHIVYGICGLAAAVAVDAVGVQDCSERTERRCACWRYTRRLLRTPEASILRPWASNMQHFWR